MSQGVLSGIRVLDFGRFIAGPFCGALLADHGADVIRIDKVGGSEDRFVLPLAQSGEGGLYMQVNRGKRSLTLEPTTPEGREIVRKLIARADIVIANLPGSTLKSMGLDYATVSAINPRVILVATNAFGQTGPDAHKVGFDGIGQAMSGTVFMSGDPDAPRRASVNYVDFGTAISAAFGAMLALMARERSWARPGGQRLVDGDRPHVLEFGPDRAGDLETGSHPAGQSRLWSGACGPVQMFRWPLADGAGGRPAAVGEILQDAGRGGLARRSALQG